MRQTALLMLLSITLASAPAAAQDWEAARRVVLEEASRHDWTTETGMHGGAQRIVERLICETGDQRWGRKSTIAGPVSGDTIAYRLGDLTLEGLYTRMHVVDFCGGCGAPGARIMLWAVDHGVIADQRFIPVTVDCDPAPPPEPPGHDPDPPGEPVDRELLLRFVEAQERTAAAVEQLHALLAGIALRFGLR